MVIGGTRSGKSEIAEKLFMQWAGSGCNPAIYVATGPAHIEGDEAWAERLAAHRARRPSTWKTLEIDTIDELARQLDIADVPVLVDSLTLVGASVDSRDHGLDSLVQAIERRRRNSLLTVLVADEVGLSVHPVFSAGIAFQDQAGIANSSVASVCDSVLLAVAGWVVELSRLPGSPFRSSQGSRQ
ncbi:MAG: bifunctional adenosylcobinamide kinase/adenosylcobinamide-phosphate guanylyltransferase [Actinobacteria bacterium]|nr:bifunctional adenosylcobinamide kinase/adenosylcobinamide-phosphate guanylyltransferase [Actinomycetota bacterium]